MKKLTYARLNSEVNAENILSFPVCFINADQIIHVLDRYYSELMMDQFCDIFFDIMEGSEIRKASLHDEYEVNDNNKDKLEQLLAGYKLELNGERCRFCSWEGHNVYEVEIINHNEQSTNSKG